MNKLLLLSILTLSAAGCESDGEKLLRLKDGGKDNKTNIHGEPKPAYREVTDEFGLGKGWKF